MVSRKAVICVMVGILIIALAEPVVFRLADMDCLNSCWSKFEPEYISLMGGQNINGSFGQSCYCDFPNKTKASKYEFSYLYDIQD